ncbi:MAG: dephospho-CoA kinase, partial [Spirochaetes bacterium]|nr:dephospho-CoA kinase [Spirochaetota bacterium]
MKTIGITGAIGSGKTRISQLFQRHGYAIIDLDSIGHRILEMHKFKKRVSDQFGKYILKNNRISREKLRKIVFYNPEYLHKLNEIIHPELIKQLKKEILIHKKKRVKAIVIDAALLFELKIDYL